MPLNKIAINTRRVNNHEKCLICGSIELKKIERYQHAYLVKCTSCKFIFAKNIPAEEELLKHYLNYPREHYISPITISRYHEILSSFEKYRKTNNILDVGCGSGYFLVEAKKKKWNVYGTEYTNEAITICKGKQINIKKGELTSSDFSKIFFDIITSFEVIEHINYPQKEVRSFYQFLRPGGVAYITTPNFNSVSRFFLKDAWNIIEYPEHLSYYTKNTLNQLFVKNGFKNISFKITGISLNRIKSGMKCLNKSNSYTYNFDETLRLKIDKSVFFKLLKYVVNFFLILLGIGDTLKAIYQKK